MSLGPVNQRLKSQRPKAASQWLLATSVSSPSCGQSGPSPRSREFFLTGPPHGGKRNILYGIYGMMSRRTGGKRRRPRGRLLKRCLNFFSNIRPLFSQGDFVLLGAWPKWVLCAAADRLPRSGCADPFPPAEGGCQRAELARGPIWAAAIARWRRWCWCCCGSRRSWLRNSNRSKTSSRWWWTIRAAWASPRTAPRERAGREGAAEWRAERSAEEISDAPLPPGRQLHARRQVSTNCSRPLPSRTSATA